jgi:hypothetical protein
MAEGWKDLDNRIAARVDQLNQFLRTGRNEMSLGTILIVVLILILLGVIPTWPHSRGWGYYPSGAVGVLLVIILILLLMGRL